MTIATMLARLDADTGEMSSTTSIQRLPSFAAIVALGDEAVPALIEQLKTRPRIAIIMLLERITGRNPAAALRGDIRQSAQAWIAAQNTGSQ